MKKPFKILSSSAMAAALATTALVPAASAATPVPAEATQLADAVFNSNGKLVTLNILTYTDALAVKAVEDKPSHVTAKDGSVYKISDYVDALAVEKSTEKALELLYNTDKAVKADLVPGKIVNKKVVPEKEVELNVDERINIVMPKEIVADGVTTEVVKFQLLDKNGNVDTSVNDVVLSINSTYGYLSQTRVTVQNGQAEVILRSEFLKNAVDAKVTAQVIEAKDGQHKELIGKVAGESKIKFIPAGGSGQGQTVKIKSLTAANSNEADRVTLFFDEEMTMADFYETNKNGLVLDNGQPKLLNNVLVTQQRNSKDGHSIEAIVIDENNKKQVTVIFDKNDTLKDNSDVYVEFTDKLNDVQKSSNATFKLADARVPNVTSVNYMNPKQIEVKFSEPIDTANFSIDGMHSSVGEKPALDVDFGNLKFVNGAWEDTRHIAIITLNENYQEPELNDKNQYVYPAGYFKPGVHSLETSNIHDFAAKGDDGDKNNIGTTQVLEFEVPADNQQVVVTRFVDSPEQFRVNFNKEFKFVKGGAQENIKLQVWDGTLKDGLGDWVNVEEHDFGGERASYVITELKDSKGQTKNEFKIELQKDWTVIYDTKTTKKNYYNDTFRVFIDKEAVQTAANGKKNEKEFDLRLTTINGIETALATPDVKSPTIEQIRTVYNTNNRKDVDHFIVEMSEPVKLLGHNDPAGGTLAQDQQALPETKVEFLGSYKDNVGRDVTVTFPGTVIGYVEDGLDDKIKVMWDTNSEAYEVNGKQVYTPQQLVDAGGSTDWTIVVKSISDDVGNTAPTNTEKFQLKPTEAPAKGVFQVQPFGGEAIGDGKWSSKHGGNGEEFAVEGEKGDTITITYSQAVAVTGLGSAIDVKNYTLNGKDLPVGTSISVVPQSKADQPQKVVIKLPENTLTPSNVITLAKNIKSKKDETLQYDLTFTFKLKSEATDAEKTELEEAIVAAEAAASDPNITPASKEALQEAIDAAKEVAKLDEPTSKEVKDAIAALEKAKKDLQPKADNSALLSKIKEATDFLNGEDIKDGKKPALEKAIEAAQKVADNGDATDQEIKDATTTLENAINAAKGVVTMTGKDVKLDMGYAGMPGKHIIAIYVENIPENVDFDKVFVVLDGEEKELKLNGDSYKIMVSTPDVFPQEQLDNITVIFK